MKQKTASFCPITQITSSLDVNLYLIVYNRLLYTEPEHQGLCVSLSINNSKLASIIKDFSHTTDDTIGSVEHNISDMNEISSLSFTVPIVNSTDHSPDS